tara:strand:+ start:467 stop:682 length:216 start_codon:yes stop_codon:yes gene_type:complete
MIRKKIVSGGWMDTIDIAEDYGFDPRWEEEEEMDENDWRLSRWVDDTEDRAIEYLLAIGIVIEDEFAGDGA